ncbi:hypothetical protein FQN53_008485 [Emmonsiellopsis sp. PD_33]|nr:hypothetical protein FQN53_008485 [Emmonsiellopsis sp. PD_33]
MDSQKGPNNNTAAAGSSLGAPPVDNGTGSRVTDALDGNVSPFASNEDWDSERKLVTALSMLQQMEAKIHTLRTLVPNRLLSPLAPIVNPDPRTPIPKSPQEMFDQLAQAARDGVAEVESFKSEWQSPDMKLIWDRIDQKMAESKGDHPATTGMWERDYDAILRKLDEGERMEKDQKRRLEEEQERIQVASSETGWREIVERYQKMDMPISITIPPVSDNAGRFFVVAKKISLQFHVIQGPYSGPRTPREWQVMAVSRGNTTKLEAEILDCIRSRDRKWDLPYLLDMICSYSDVKRTRCVTCNQLTDTNAQLPSFRKPTPVESADNKTTFTWVAYHPGCLNQNTV